jgi:spore coat polysaccharide biosynthesis protein SpsF
MTNPATATPKKVVAIIQARMGSSRLPGKMMEPIMGQPLMYHIIARALQIRCAQAVYLATTDQPIDDPLVEIAEAMGLKVVRGSEDNVMQRFFLAIDDADADYIIRICGDAPLFDPDFMDRSISTIVPRDADCVRASWTGPTAFQGAGVISRRALEWSRAVAPHDPRTYEHVTAYAYDHMEKLKTVPIDIEPEFRGKYKLSIDTGADLEFFRQLYAQIFQEGKIVSLKAALQYIDEQNKQC